MWQIRGHKFCCRGCGVGGGGICVVGSAAEASSVGFPFWGASCSQLHVVEEMWMMFGGSRVFCCTCIFVFVRACYPVPISLVSGADTAVHTWVDVELRVVRQHVAVNIKNPNRSWVHNLGPQQKSIFLPWTGVLEGGLGSVRGVVLGHLARTKMLGLPEQFWVARLLEDVVELVFWGYPLSVIRGLVHSLPCSRVAQIGRKTVRTWLAKASPWWQWESQRSIWWCQRLWVARPAGFGKKERFVRLPLRPPVNLGGNVVQNRRKLKRRRHCWRSMIRSIGCGKRRPRRRRGRWNCRSKQRCWPRL